MYVCAYDYDSKKKHPLNVTKVSVLIVHTLYTQFIIITINNLHLHKVHFRPQIVLTNVADRL